MEKPMILIVDDQPSNIMPLIEILKDKYRVTAVNSGAKALETVKKEIPDLILLDVVMPEIDGFEVCRKLKESPETSKIPIIFVTIMGEQMNEAKGLELGAVDYLTKPVIPQLVLARVKNHLELSNYRRGLEHAVIEKTKELTSLNHEIESTLEDILYKLGGVAEARSQETGNHIRRVAAYTYNLALLHGLSQEDADLIQLASSMHDIGKIATPDHILTKPGKLTPEEFDIIKEHSVKGYGMLNGSQRTLFKASAIIAHEHHEKWDGSGYPRGIKGEEIHIYGRIVALADVFDALLSKRCYKDAWSLSDVFEYIKTQSGLHFDPELVSLFIENFQIFAEISNDLRDKD